MTRARRRRHERRDRQVRAGRLRRTRNAGEARAGDREHGQLGQSRRRLGQLGRRRAAELVEVRQHRVTAALQGSGEPRVVVQLGSHHVAERRGGAQRIRIDRGLQLPEIDPRGRLVEDHVEADGSHPGGVQSIDQLCQPRPRPGPAAESREAGLVDGDDHDAVGRRDAPADQVAEVEKLAIEDLERNGRQQPHRRDRDRDPGADRSDPEPGCAHTTLAPASAPAPRDGRRWRGRLRAPGDEQRLIHRLLLLGHRAFARALRMARVEPVRAPPRSGASEVGRALERPELHLRERRRRERTGSAPHPGGDAGAEIDLGGTSRVHERANARQVVSPTTRVPAAQGRRRPGSSCRAPPRSPSGSRPRSARSAPSSVR